MSACPSQVLSGNAEKLPTKMERTFFSDIAALVVRVVVKCQLLDVIVVRQTIDAYAYAFRIFRVSSEKKKG